jgi:trigger factor
MGSAGSIWMSHREKIRSTMNITKEQVDELNALLKVKVAPDDYQSAVDQTLADYRKKASIPGFRKGKVPMGLIKKQYGKAVLVDELNKLVSDKLQDYIHTEKLDILGSPLPVRDEALNGDFDQQNEFEFTYEIGLSPKIEIKISGKNKYDYTKVKVDEALIDKQMNDLTRRYGKLVSGEKIGEKDLVMGQFVELDENEAIKEGGILNSATISIEFVEKEKVKKSLLGKKIGDKVVVNPFDVSRGGKDTAAMLAIKEDELDGISDKFQFTINEIKVMEPAELNQDLFDKLYGKDVIKSEEEMRARIKNDLEQMFLKDSDKILMRRVVNDLIDKTKFELPNDFLKRWILSNQKEDSGITLEDIEKDYANYSKSLKWQLIENQLFKANDIKVQPEEVMEYTKYLLAEQYANYGMPAPEDDELTASARQVLSNKDEGQRIYEMLAEDKLLKYFKETVKLTDKEVSYDDFLKIAQDDKA